MRAAVASPDELAVLDAMESEHAQLDPQLERIDTQVGAGLASDAATSIRAASGLALHMRHEENAALPLVDAYLGRAGWAGFARHIRSTQGISGAAEYLPWLLDGAPADLAKQVLGALPSRASCIERSGAAVTAPACPEPTGSARCRERSVRQTGSMQPRPKLGVPLFPEPEVDQGDPFLVCDDTGERPRFYVYVTSPGFPVYASDDLLDPSGWTRIGASMPAMDVARWCWAPCVRYLPHLDRPWVMLYSKARGRGPVEGHIDHRIIALTANPPPVRSWTPDRC